MKDVHPTVVINNNNAFFDTVTVDLSAADLTSAHVQTNAARHKLNVRRSGPKAVTVAFDETSTFEDVEALLLAFHASPGTLTCCSSVDPCVLSSRVAIRATPSTHTPVHTHTQT